MSVGSDVEDWFVLRVYSERLESQEYSSKWAEVQEVLPHDLIFWECLCSQDENEEVQNAFLMLSGQGIRAEGKQPLSGEGRKAPEYLLCFLLQNLKRLRKHGVVYAVWLLWFPFYPLGIRLLLATVVLHPSLTIAPQWPWLTNLLHLCILLSCSGLWQKMFSTWPVS